MSEKLPTNITIQVPRYKSLEAPNGFLDDSRACHALWTYYTMAMNAFEKITLSPIVLEGHADQSTDFRQLMNSLARAYGVEPEEMTKCWYQVDLQCDLMGYPRLPNSESLRFTSAIIIPN